MHLTFDDGGLNGAVDGGSGEVDKDGREVDEDAVCVIALVADEDSSRGPCVVVLPSVVDAEPPLCKSLSISLKLPPHSSRPESAGCTQTFNSLENTVPGPHENS